MISYTIKPAVEEGGEVSVVKVGHTHEFKMSEVKTHMEFLATKKKELVAQRDLESAKMENIRHFNEIIATLTSEQIAAIALYEMSVKIHKACVDKLVEIDEADAEYAQELEEIKTQTGLVL